MYSYPTIAATPSNARTAVTSDLPRLHERNRDFRWAPARASGLRRLTPDQTAAFNAQGFFVLENAFTAAELAKVTAAIDPLEEANEQYIRDELGGQFRLTTVGTITFTAHIVRKSAVLRDFAAHSAIKDVCHDLIGDDVRLYWDQSVYKKTGKVQEFPWHQDNGYTYVEPQQYLTIWIPLVDVDDDNGCPWIAPGRHLQGTLAHWLTPIGLKCLDEVADAVAAPARAGDAIIFSSLAPHRTGPNLRKDSVRKAYILQYAPDGALAYPAAGGVVELNDPERQFKVLDNGR